MIAALICIVEMAVQVVECHCVKHCHERLAVLSQRAIAGISRRAAVKRAFGSDDHEEVYLSLRKKLCKDPQEIQVSQTNLADVRPGIEAFDVRRIFQPSMMSRPIRFWDTAAWE